MVILLFWLIGGIVLCTVIYKVVIENIVLEAWGVTIFVFGVLLAKFAFF